MKYCQTKNNRKTKHDKFYEIRSSLEICDSHDRLSIELCIAIIQIETTVDKYGRRRNFGLGPPMSEWEKRSNMINA